MSYRPWRGGWENADSPENSTSRKTEPHFMAHYGQGHRNDLLLPKHQSAFIEQKQLERDVSELRRMLNNSEFINEIALALIKNSDLREDLEDAVEGTFIDIRIQNAELKQKYKGESETQSTGYSKNNLADPKLREFSKGCYSGPFATILDRVGRFMTDDPAYFEPHQHHEVRVFTAKAAKAFIENVGDDKERLDRAWLVLLDMARANGFRKRLQPTAEIHQALKNLRDEFPNFVEVTDYIANQLRAWPLVRQEKRIINPILLNGPKGCGKSAYAHALADCLGTASSYLNLASTSGYTILTGLSQKWGNGQAGLICQKLTRGDHASPVVLLDEIDKAAQDTQLPVEGALLSLLDPNISKRFKDEFGHLEFDASNVIYLATANEVSRISPPIKSRFKVFDIRYPDSKQRISIIKRIVDKTYINTQLSENAMQVLAVQGGDLRLLTQLIEKSILLHVEGVLESGKYLEHSSPLNNPQIISEFSVVRALETMGVKRQTIQI